MPRPGPPPSQPSRASSETDPELGAKGWRFVPRVAVRLMGRGDEGPPPWTGWLAVACAVAGLGAAVVHFAGDGAPWTAITVLVATLVGIGTVCFRRLVPTLAVTVIGVSLGVASLQIVLAVVSGFDRELVEGISSINGHLAVTKYGLDFFEYEELGTRLRRDPRIVRDSPFAYGTVAVAGEEEASRGLKVVQVKGVLPERAAAFPGFNATLRGGDASVITPAQPHEPPGAALGYRLARDLGLEVGDSIVLVAPHALDGTRATFEAAPRSATYRVNDLVESGVLYIDERIIVTHLTAAQALLFGEGRVTGIELQLIDRELAEEVARDVSAQLNEGLHLPPFRTVTWRQQGAGLLGLLQQIRVVLSVVLGLIIVVAGSTLVMSLLLLVRRRRHDIAILGAMGAPNHMTFWVFEGIGIAAGLLGAAAGVAAGTIGCVMLSTMRFVLADGIYPVEYLPVAFQPLDALVPALVSVLACSLVSGPIALGAARVRTIEALRL